MKIRVPIFIGIIALGMTSLTCSKPDSSEGAQEATAAPVSEADTAETLTEKDNSTEAEMAVTDTMAEHDDHDHIHHHDSLDPTDNPFDMIQGFTELQMGDGIPEFTPLKDAISGEMMSHEDIEGEQLTVIAFMCNHCPFVVGWEPTLVKYANDYADKGVKVISINSNIGYNLEASDEMKRETPEMMKARAEKLSFPYPYLIDEGQVVARSFGAIDTPDIFVFHKDHGLVYNGDIDDNKNVVRGDPSAEDAVSNHFLRDVTEAFLAGKPYTMPENVNVGGCTIKFDETREENAAA